VRYSLLCDSKLPLVHGGALFGYILRQVLTHIAKRIRCAIISVVGQWGPLLKAQTRFKWPSAVSLFHAGHLGIPGLELAVF